MFFIWTVDDKEFGEGVERRREVAVSSGFEGGKNEEFGVECVEGFGCEGEDKGVDLLGAVNVGETDTMCDVGEEGD
jgi:hypothetical protein